MTKRRRTGFGRGRGKLVCLSVSLKWRGEGCKALDEHGGDAHIGSVTGIFDNIPGEPTREQIQERLRQVYGNTEDTEYLIDHLDKVWDKFDFLKDLFSVEDARKMINALSSGTLS